MAFAFALSVRALPEDLQSVISYYNPEMSKGFIFISKVDMTLTLVDSQGDVVVSYPIACGENIGQKQVRGDHKTPEGHFLIQNIQEASNWGHDFHDGKGFIRHAYGPYFLRLQTGFQGIGIHGTHAPESIGTRATEGCIRLENENIEALEHQVSLGMPVIIGPEAGVESLIASNVPSPKRPSLATRKSSLTPGESTTSPLIVERKLTVIDGLIDIEPEKDLIDPIVVEVPDFRPTLTPETVEPLIAMTEPEPASTLTVETPVVPEMPAAEPEKSQPEPAAEQTPAQQSQSADSQDKAPQRKHRRRTGPTYIKPDTTSVNSSVPVTPQQYEVVVVEVTQPDGTVKYEVQYKPI